MQTTNVSALNKSIQNSNSWFIRLQELGSFKDTNQAYTAFRAVVHAVRDRLTVDEAAHLASHMPALIRGVYFEGFKPSVMPIKDRTPDDFRDNVSETLDRNNTIDIDDAIEAVLELLEEQIDGGQFKHVRLMIPNDILEAWEQVPTQLH